MLQWFIIHIQSFIMVTMTCMISTPKTPPTSFSVPYLFNLGLLAKTTSLSECFWSHMWPSFSLDLGLPCVLSVCPQGLDSESRVMSILTCHTFTHNMLSMFFTLLDQSIIVPVNMKLRLCSSFMGRSHSQSASPWSGTEMYGKL